MIYVARLNRTSPLSCLVLKSDITFLQFWFFFLMPLLPQLQ